MKRCAGHRKEAVVFKQCRLPYSPIGAIANEFDGLKIALQWFPARRGADCTALNYPKQELIFSRGKRNEYTYSNGRWKRKELNTSPKHADYLC